MFANVKPVRKLNLSGCAGKARPAWGAGFRLGLAAVLLLLVAGGALPAEAQPLRRMGQHPRSLAMGGTGVSFSNDEMALFYNPAGLGAVDKWWFEWGAMMVEGSPDGLADTTALLGSGLGSTISDPSTVVANNLGKELQVRAFAFPNLMINFAPGYTLGVAYFLEEEKNIRIIDTDPALPEIDGFFRKDEGQVAGFSFPAAHGRMLMGISLRSFTRTSGEGIISNAALTAAGAASTLNLETELAAVTGSGIGYDLGLIWRMNWLSSMRAQFGMAVNNAGGVALKDTAGVEVGQVPQEVSMGWSIRPHFLSHTLIALEFRDVTKELTTDGDDAKRVHLGVEMGFLALDKATQLLTLRGGVSAGMPSFGIEFSLWHGFALHYAEYYQEYGAVAGEDPRKRKVAQVLIGF